MQFKERCERTDTVHQFVCSWIRPPALRVWGRNACFVSLLHILQEQDSVLGYKSTPLWALKWLPNANQNESCCGKSVREIKRVKAGTDKGMKEAATKVWISKHSAIRSFINLNIHPSLFSHSFLSCVFPPLYALASLLLLQCCVPQCQRALWQQDIDSGRVAVNMGINMCVCVSLWIYSCIFATLYSGIKTQSHKEVALWNESLRLREINGARGLLMS